MLALFLVPVTLIFHDFWAFDGQELQNQMPHFMKNITIIGGLLTVAAAGAGPLSVDSYRAQEETAARELSEALAHSA